MPRLGNVLAPRDRLYFELFEQAGKNMHQAAVLLDQLLSEWIERRGLAT